MDTFFRRRTIILLVLVGLIFFSLSLYSKFYDNHKFVQSLPNYFNVPGRAQQATNVQFTTVITNATSTPAKRRLNMDNRKCNVFTQLDQTSFTKAKLKFSRGNAVMYVYDGSDLISKNIMSYGSWEGGLLNGIETVFNIDPTMNLIDIGCNLGVYTLVGAMRNRKVVAVDANINNMKRLRRSLVENKVDKNVKLLYNAISDKYSTFSLTIQRGNIGHTVIGKLTSSEAHPVKSIYMDDILEVVDFNRAILKIDIEGHEAEAFRKADKLFTEVDIPIVMMEWHWIGLAEKPVPTAIISFFTKFGYKAYKDIFQDTPLNNDQYKTWPWDIVWKRS